MKSRFRALLFRSLVVSFGTPAAYAICPDTDCDPNASEFLVREDCNGRADCFEDAAKLWGASDCVGSTTNDPDPMEPYGTILTSNGFVCTTKGWLWNDVVPSAASPVSIDVGPGTFDPFVCLDHEGFVTLRGAGREATTLSGSVAGARIFSCDELTFAQARFEGGAYGVYWTGAGESTWSRVDMVASGGFAVANGWFDTCNGFLDPGNIPSEHFFYDSVVAGGAAVGVSTRPYAYFTNCAETYFFGGAIRDTGIPGPGASSNVALAAYTSAEFFGFGTELSVRPRVDGGVGFISIGVLVQTDATVTLHDSSIDIVGGAGSLGISEESGGTVRRFATPIEVTTP